MPVACRRPACGLQAAYLWPACGVAVACCGVAVGVLVRLGRSGRAVPSAADRSAECRCRHRAPLPLVARWRAMRKFLCLLDRGCGGVGALGAFGVRGAVSGRPLCGMPLPPSRAPSARGAVEGDEEVSLFT